MTVLGVAAAPAMGWSCGAQYRPPGDRLQTGDTRTLELEIETKPREHWFTITEEAPTRAFFWLKEPASAHSRH